MVKEKNLISENNFTFIFFIFIFYFYFYLFIFYFLDLKKSEFKEWNSKNEKEIPNVIDLLQIGENEFEIKESIGEGGFGKVFKGIWRNQFVAIKELKSKYSNELSKIEFEKESKILFHLRYFENYLKWSISQNENRYHWRHGRGTDPHSCDHSKFGKARKRQTHILAWQRP